ncbi:hypothetical protein [Acinetobacter rudis]|uniref:hypothetical protein n=1 Tax=Acinetobacter rudis TaxID=632955 RepID=UPI00333EB94A
MDIQKEILAYLNELLLRKVITQKEFEDLIFIEKFNVFHSDYLSSLTMGEINFGWPVWQAAKATPQHQTYFSHDFNGDGFKYHNTLDEAQKEALANLEWYQERVADGHHVNEDGNFNELCYGVVIESAGYSVEDIVTEKHHANNEYTQYEVGTEILSLGLYKAKAAEEK